MTASSEHAAGRSSRTDDTPAAVEVSDSNTFADPHDKHAYGGSTVPGGGVSPEELGDNMENAGTGTGDIPAPPRATGGDARLGGAADAGVGDITGSTAGSDFAAELRRPGESSDPSAPGIHDKT